MNVEITCSRILQDWMVDSRRKNRVYEKRERQKPSCLKSYITFNLYESLDSGTYYTYLRFESQIISAIPLPRCWEENREFSKPKFAYKYFLSALHIPLRDNAHKIMLLMCVRARACVCFMCVCIYSIHASLILALGVSDKSRKYEKEV